uniref:DUF148 domain-containing protein n=1 Tax=Strongyloides papillosus TaxID=174720 RepID=A0A0N5C5R3_STREA
MVKFISAILVAIFAVVYIAAQGNDQVPPFLVGAPQSVHSSFEAVIKTNANKPEAEIDKAVEDWVSKQDASIKTKFAQFKTQVAQMNKEAEAAHNAALTKFSAEAKAADAQMSAIAANSALSPQQKGQQIEAIMKALKPSVKAEIEQAMQG